MIEPHCLTIALMLPRAGFRPLSRAGENGFVGGKNGFVRTSRAGGAAVENSGRPVNSCAASIWETKRILAPEAVDMLRTDVPIHRRGKPETAAPTASTIRGIAGPSPAKGDNPATMSWNIATRKSDIGAAVKAAKDSKRAGVDGRAPSMETPAGTKPFRRVDETILKPAWAI
jgi:hypothetical protein